MQVVFSKIGKRRYAINILRDGFEDLEINPAPGFDDLMPHDLCHLVVEQILNIENGIYGQIDQKGTAGSFSNSPSETKNSKQASRKRRKLKKKGKKLVNENRDDLAKSERATYVCWQNWLAHLKDSKLREKAVDMQATASGILNQMSAAERSIYTKETLARVRKRMGELSHQWQNLEIGQAMTVEW